MAREPSGREEVKGTGMGHAVGPRWMDALRGMAATEVRRRGEGRRERERGGSHRGEKGGGACATDGSGLIDVQRDGWHQSCIHASFMMHLAPLFHIPRATRLTPLLHVPGATRLTHHSTLHHRRCLEAEAPLRYRCLGRRRRASGWRRRGGSAIDWCCCLEWR